MAQACQLIQLYTKTKHMDMASLAMTAAAAESSEMHVEHSLITGTNWHGALVRTTFERGTNSSRIGTGQ
jgi:hypothetical protein